MEREIIQSVGFRNLVEDGVVTGFQFKVRLPYYRGVFSVSCAPATSSWTASALTAKT